MSWENRAPLRGALLDNKRSFRNDWPSSSRRPRRDLQRTARRTGRFVNRTVGLPFLFPCPPPGLAPDRHSRPVRFPPRPDWPPQIALLAVCPPPAGWPAPARHHPVLASSLSLFPSPSCLAGSCRPPFLPPAPVSPLASWLAPTFFPCSRLPAGPVPTLPLSYPRGWRHNQPIRGDKTHSMNYAPWV